MTRHLCALGIAIAVVAVPIDVAPITAPNKRIVCTVPMKRRIRQHAKISSRDGPANQLPSDSPVRQDQDLSPSECVS
jgi:hypothetical protein